MKKRIIEKLRIIYKTGYTHEFWVYNLKVNKEGEYTWLHCDQGNRIIDLQPEHIISIFVVKRKTSFYWSKIRVRKPPKPKVVLDQFKPKPPLGPMGDRNPSKKNLNSMVAVSDEVLLEMTTDNPSKFGY